MFQIVRVAVAVLRPFGLVLVLRRLTVETAPRDGFRTYEPVPGLAGIRVSIARA